MFRNQLSLLAAIGLCAFQATLLASGWPEVFELSNGLDAKQIDPESGAENLIRWLEVDDEEEYYLIRNYYYRVKVFNERGVEDLKLIELEGEWEGKLGRIKARVSYPDGRTIEIEQDAFVEAEKFRFGHYKAESVRFAPPQLEPGCVIDYSWTVLHRYTRMRYTTLFAQSHLPTHQLTFRIRYFPEYASAWTWHQIESDTFAKSGFGNYHSLTLNNLPAAVGGNYMPPDTETQPWLFTYYRHDKGPTWIDKFWKRYAGELDDTYRKAVRPRDTAIVAKARDLTKDLTTDREKLEALYRFCQTEIKNLKDPAHGYIEDEADSMMNKIKHAGDVFAARYGESSEINFLFASLATAIGYEPRLVVLNDRTRRKFLRSNAVGGLMSSEAIAIYLDSSDEWLFCSPGNWNLPFGFLHFRNEGTAGLLNGRKEAVLLNTGYTRANQNGQVRKADLELDEYGNLKGTITLFYQGQYGLIYRNSYDELSYEKQVESIEDDLSDHYSNFSMSNLKIENLRQTDQILKVSFDIEIEGYADRSSNRLFFRPSVFTMGNDPDFVEPERAFDIVFRYLQTVRDEVTIKFPAGYELDLAEAPPGMLKEGPIRHQILIRSGKDGRSVRLDRNYVVDLPRIAVDQYDAVKQIWDGMYDQDGHIMTLRAVDEVARPTEDAEPAIEVPAGR